MAHTVYTTNSIVLSSTDVADSDKLFWLLTEDLGLLFASAKSIREETSKLRYTLQDLAYIRVSLVRGRGLWRITGSESKNKNTLLSMEKKKVFGRMISLTKRLLPNEEENKEIFSVLENSISALCIYKDDMEVVESIAIARILYYLGYLSYTEENKYLIETVEFTQDVIDKGKKLKSKLVLVINEGIIDSQL